MRPKHLFDFILSVIAIFHFLQVFFSLFFFIHNGWRVVFTNNYSTLLLLFYWHFPWFVNIFLRHLRKLRTILLNVMTMFIWFLVKWYRSVNSEILMEKSTCAQPLPISIVQGPISIEEKLFKNLSTLFPMHPKMSSG